MNRSTTIAAFALLFSMGCDPAEAHRVSSEPKEKRVSTTAPAPVTDASTNATHTEKTPASPAPLTTAPYPWHGDETIDTHSAVTTLEQRFAPPPGYQRVAVQADGFGAWLRPMPLAAPDTPVLAYDGELLLPADHSNLAGVTTLDTGSRDLQQCADAIMRLHGEWLWHRGRAEEASYPTGAGPIAWKRYKTGAYPAAKGRTFVWRHRGKARSEDHATYRKYLDVVFAWSNTGALAIYTTEVKRAEARPGDFFVLAGNPGHSVLILDIAENAEGKRVALLGQSFMPAQSFQILRPSRDRTWFSLEDDRGVDTPFWVRFPWSSLRRLDAP